MHYRVRYLLDFDLKIRSGQVWRRYSKNEFSQKHLQKGINPNTYLDVIDILFFLFTWNNASPLTAKACEWNGFASKTSLTSSKALKVR